MDKIPYTEGYTIVNVLSYVFAYDFMPLIKYKKVATNPLTAEVSLALGIPIECLVRSIYPLIIEELQAVFAHHQESTKGAGCSLMLLEIDGGEILGLVVSDLQLIAVDSSQEQPFPVKGISDISLRYKNIYAVYCIIGEMDTSQAGGVRIFTHEELAHIFAGLNAPRSPETV